MLLHGSVLGCLTLLLAAWAPTRAAQAQATAGVDDLVDRAAAYVAEYERAFSTIVSEERYVQRLSGGLSEVRQLRSDLILTSAGEAGWILFRDVYDVDGRPVRDRDDRVMKLLLDPPADAYAQAKRIADEGARFNVGPIQRTINVPTLALMFLRRDNVPRSRFRLAGRETVHGVGAVVVRFEEQQRPRLVQTRDDAAARGRFWIESATGRVLKSELELDSAGISATVVVTYARQPSLGLWVPESMVERYRTESGLKSQAVMRDVQDGVARASALTIEGYATYAKFRRFNVDVTTIIRLP